MTLDDFATTVGLDTALLEPAFEIFQEELAIPSKTRAARCADFADGLRRLGVGEDVVYVAVAALVRECRR